MRKTAASRGCEVSNLVTGRYICSYILVMFLLMIDLDNPNKYLSTRGARTMVHEGAIACWLLTLCAPIKKLIGKVRLTIH